jgi:flagellar motor switch protein FliN/FliY
MNKLHATSVHSLELADLSGRPEPSGPSLLEGPLALLGGVKVTLSTSLGGASMSVAELLALKDGSVVQLDRLANEPVDILLDGKVVARGHLVAVADNFGISITQAPQATTP